MKQGSPVTTALLGVGYTLERLITRLPFESTVLVARSSERVAELRAVHPNVEQMDLRDEESVRDFFQKYRQVRTVVDSIPPLRDEQHSPARGAAAIVRWAPESLRRLVYLSTTGVFGVTDGSFVNETTPAVPMHVRGKARYLVEEEYRTLPCEVVCLRIPAIYGPGRGIGRALKAQRFPYIDDGERWSNRIHVEDLAECVYQAATTKNVLPPVLCIGDDAPTQTREVVAHYCEHFSLPFPESITREQAVERRMHSLLSHQRIENTLMKQVLDVSLKYPTYKEGAGTEFLSEL